VADILTSAFGIAWLPAAVALTGAVLGMVADMGGRVRLGLRIIGLGLLAAATLSLGRALMPPSAAGSYVEWVFDVVRVGSGFSGYAAVICCARRPWLGGRSGARRGVRSGRPVRVA